MDQATDVPCPKEIPEANSLRGLAHNQCPHAALANLRNHFGFHGSARPEILLPNPNYLETPRFLLFRTEFPIVYFQLVSYVFI
jgi:hypothetical protein